MKLADVTTASDRLGRINQSIVILEGLIVLLDKKDQDDCSVTADTSAVLLAAQAQIDAVDSELTWLREIQSDLKQPAPDSDERDALKQAGVKW